MVPVLDLASGKPPGETRVVVAMSGGVDSSVAAAWCQAAGYEVVGVTLHLYDHELPSLPRTCFPGSFAESPQEQEHPCVPAIPRRRSCCASQDIVDARRVADHLAIPHYVFDFRDRFSATVLQDFADGYSRGETPSPCIRCNQHIKFHDLLDAALALGADLLITGHYARHDQGPGGAELHQGKDPQRDQSYFLFATPRDRLAFLRFPLAALDKTRTRELATFWKLPVARKPDSQDLCFVPFGAYSKVVAALRPDSPAVTPGEIVDLSGQVLGQHSGTLHFTIGQRRGLGIGGRQGTTGDPLHVVRLDPSARQVVVGPRTALRCWRIRLRDINRLDDEPFPIGTPGSFIADVKFRSRQSLQPARIHLTGGREGMVELEDPAEAVAPGQACVFYRRGRVLGGGWIVATDSPR